jgi:hypothetical protein
MCQELKPCILKKFFLCLKEQESLGKIAVILEDLAWEIKHSGSNGSRAIKYLCNYR